MATSVASPVDRKAACSIISLLASRPWPAPTLLACRVSSPRSSPPPEGSRRSTSRSRKSPRERWNPTVLALARLLAEMSTFVCWARIPLDADHNPKRLIFPSLDPCDIVHGLAQDLVLGLDHALVHLVGAHAVEHLRHAAHRIHVGQLQRVILNDV